MADKNLSRDEALLRKILEHMDDLSEALVYFNCGTVEKFTSGSKEAKFCKKSCTNDVMQIGELSKGLTDQTVKSIRILSGNTLITLRNSIAHKYEKIRFDIMFSFIRECCSKKTRQEVIQRIKYCHENKRAR